MELLGSITLADISDGSNGKGINWLGDFDSHPTNPTENDAYYNTTDRISYIYKNGTWSILAKDGQEGQNGQDGNTYSLNGSKGKIVRYKIKDNTICIDFKDENAIDKCYEYNFEGKELIIRDRNNNVFNLKKKNK